MKRSRLVLAAIAALLTAGACLRAEEPSQVYDRVYGGEAQKLKPKDYAGFVEKLLKDSAELEGNAPLAELMVSKAVDLYLKCPAGDEKTMLGEALIDRLVSVGEGQVKADKPSAAVQTYQEAARIASANKSSRLSDVAIRLKALQARMEVEKKLSDLLARWKVKPDDPVLARELVLLYVVELDKPAEAAPYLPAVADEAYRTYAPLAAKEAGAVAEPVLNELAGWYKSMAAAAGPAGKAVTYGRAKLYYEAFLARHATKDVDYLAAKQALEAIAAELKKLSSAGLTAPDMGKEVTLNLGKGVALKLVLIPAGKFTMGSPGSEKDRSGAESPQCEVTISKAFHLGATEVTQTQYEAVMGKNPSQFKGAQNPVETVSWDEAVEFCKKLSAKMGRTVRLPTEAQWEYACRAGSKTRFSYGDDDDYSKLDDYAWSSKNSGRSTHPVGQKKPNAFGLYDMHGNVWEWCSDHYADSYANAKNEDPQGPGSGADRVLRGGTWNLDPQNCRSARRIGHVPDYRSFSVGFRVVVDVK